MKVCRDASHLLLSLLLLFVYFFALTSLLTSSFYLVVFYTYLRSFLSSRAADYGVSVV